ncbi:MAG: RDD family protein [Chloroflexota bacterium]|nr:RDD family protein [Chloroflexota bacterium]
MTSDERYGITDLDQRPGPVDRSGADEDGADEPDEAGAWDLESEPAGRTLAPAADGPAPGVRYVELPIRAAAFAVDAVLLIVISDYAFRAVYTFIFSGILGPSVAQGPGSESLSMVVVTALLALVATQAVVVTYLIRVFRATPGQMAFGLFTLSRRDGRAVSPTAAFVRWLLLFAPLPVLTIGPAVVAVISQILAFLGQAPAGWFALVSTLTQLAPVAWFVVLLASVLIDESGRGLHDRLSSSVVVRREGAPS